MVGEGNKAFDEALVKEVNCFFNNFFGGGKLAFPGL